MNILLINHYAGSPKHGMEFRPYYLAREWVRLGHNAAIVAASFSHLRTQPPTLKRNATWEWLDGVPYAWLRTPSYKGNGVRRAFNMFVFVLQLYRHASRLSNELLPNVVIASSTYPLDAIPAYRIAVRSRARFVFEVHDLWPLTPIELGGMSSKHPFIRVLQWSENYAYRKANRVVSMLPKAKGHMVEHGMEEHKFVYIPNGVDVAGWQGNYGELPAPHRGALHDLKRRGLFLVGYVGGHATSNALESFIDSALELQSLPVALVLVGQGIEKDALRRRAEALHLSNVVFLPPVAKASVPALLSEMDLLFLGWRRSKLYRFGISPNKLLDYMMAAKVVLHSTEAPNDPVVESGCGLSVPPEDSRAIGAAIRHLMKLPSHERERMGARGRSYIMTHHDYRKLAAQFIDIIK